MQSCSQDMYLQAFDTILLPSSGMISARFNHAFALGARELVLVHGHLGRSRSQALNRAAQPRSPLLCSEAENGPWNAC